ncbi:MAG: hypothetical protein FWD34_08380 [Oscillospiraceae bacterium]|nr:hypothetical protein [Oscillospiraceae bacterium]
MNNDKYNLVEIFPKMCISVDKVAELFRGRFLEKVMSVSMAMVAMSLINPIPPFVVALASNDLAEGALRLVFFLSIIVIVILSLFVFENAIFIPFLVYIGVVKGFFFLEGYADAIMALIFAISFFIAFIMYRIIKPEKEEFPDEDEFDNVTIEDIQKAEAPEITDRLEFLEHINDNEPETVVVQEEAGTLEERFKFLEDMNDDEMDFSIELEKLREEQGKTKQYPQIFMTFSRFIEFYEETTAMKRIILTLSILYIANPRGGDITTLIFFGGFAAIAIVLSLALRKNLFVSAFYVLGTIKSVLYGQLIEMLICIVLVTVTLMFFLIRKAAQEKSDASDKGFTELTEEELQRVSSPKPTDPGSRFDDYHYGD